MDRPVLSSNLIFQCPILRHTRLQTSMCFRPFHLDLKRCWWVKIMDADSMPPGDGALQHWHYAVAPVRAEQSRKQNRRQTEQRKLDRQAQGHMFSCCRRTCKHGGKDMLMQIRKRERDNTWIFVVKKKGEEQPAKKNKKEGRREQTGQQPRENTQSKRRNETKNNNNRRWTNLLLSH